MKQDIPDSTEEGLCSSGNFVPLLDFSADDSQPMGSDFLQLGPIFVSWKE